MSTRAAVILQSGDDYLHFYQHSDGYPEGLGKKLKDFCNNPYAKKHAGDLEYLGTMLVFFCNKEVSNGQPVLAVSTCKIIQDTFVEYIYLIDCQTLDIKTTKTDYSSPQDMMQKVVEKVFK